MGRGGGQRQGGGVLRPETDESAIPTWPLWLGMHPPRALAGVLTVTPLPKDAFWKAADGEDGEQFVGRATT